MRARMAVGLAILATVAAGCSSAKPETSVTPQGAGDVAAAPAASKTKRDRNVITRAELDPAQLNELTAFQAIQRLRPHFFAGHGGASMQGGPSMILVYVEDSRVGGTDFLHSVRMTEVDTIRYLSGSEATLRFGTGNDGGAIVITRKK